MTNDRSGLDPDGMGKNICMRLKLYQENQREEAEAVEYHTILGFKPHAESAITRTVLPSCENGNSILTGRTNETKYKG